MSEFEDGSLKLALENKLKTVALKVYIIQNQKNFESISFAQIEDGFKLDQKKWLQILCPIIMKDYVKARIDYPTKTIIFENNPDQSDKLFVGSLPTTDRNEVDFLQ